MSRRELRRMLRRWGLLDLDGWDRLGGCVTLSSGADELRLYDEAVDSSLREDVESRLIDAARLFAAQIEVAESVYVFSDGLWPARGARDETTLLAQAAASGRITRAFGGAVKIEALTRNQLRRLMAEVTRETAYARIDCSILASTAGGHVVWSPCHHADIHVYTDGDQTVVAALRTVASASGLSAIHEPKGS